MEGLDFRDALRPREACPRHLSRSLSPSSLAKPVPVTPPSGRMHRRGRRAACRPAARTLPRRPRLLRRLSARPGRRTPELPLRRRLHRRGRLPRAFRRQAPLLRGRRTPPPVGLVAPPHPRLPRRRHQGTTAARRPCEGTPCSSRSTPLRPAAGGASSSGTASRRDVRSPMRRSSTSFHACSPGFARRPATCRGCPFKRRCRSGGQCDPNASSVARTALRQHSGHSQSTRPVSRPLSERKWQQLAVPDFLRDAAFSPRSSGVMARIIPHCRRRRKPGFAPAPPFW